MKTLREHIDTEEYLIVAHRGASGEAPENTIAAFKLAIEQGANMIEIDLQFTNEGHLIAFHDFSHLANKENISLNKLSLEELKKIDVGSWFDEKYAGEKIPKLEEIINIAKDRIYFNFEIKHNNDVPKIEQIQHLLGIIDSAGIKKYVMFSSFDYNFLKIINSLDNEIPTASIKLPNDERKPSDICRENHSQSFICSLKELNEEINENCIENNLILGVYSVDNKSDLQKVLKYKIKAFGTNYPKRIINLLKNTKQNFIL